MLLYIGGTIALLWVTMLAALPEERRHFLYVAPISIFFPGLLANGTIMSGNVAYILYGCVLLGAALGWRRDRWLWFYLSVLVASCVKAPMLSLVLIPVLSVRRQWLAAGVTALVGLALFAVQPLIWPTLFHNYLQAIDLQVRSYRDFGCGPAGLFSGILYDSHLSYSRAGLIFYLCFAVPLLGFLLYLSRLFLRGRFSFQQWLPVMLVGIMLLNPRIIEYDLAALGVSLALIAKRFLVSITSPKRSIVLFAVSFFIANAFAVTDWKLWKTIEGPLLVFLFLAGSWTLFPADPAPTPSAPQPS